MDFKTEIANALSSKANINSDELAALLEQPPNPEMGDYAFPCFKLAKSMRKSPVAIASELSAVQFPDFVNRCEVAGGYLNFFIDKAVFAKSVLSQVLQKRQLYGSSNMGNGRVICIDYSSINIAKPFHIGHLSTTVIGHALYNIYNFLGFKSVGINHLGDWGTQFGKLIVAYKLWGDRDLVQNGGIAELLSLYVKFHAQADNDPDLNDQARAWFKNIENGNEEALELFTFFKEITLKEVSRIYQMLGIEFDSYAGESFYNDKMDRVLNECTEKGISCQDNGATVVKFTEEENIPPCLLLKADGATLYATRDIAAAMYRKDTYNFYKSLYVVAYQQNLHFKQIFRVVDMLGYEWHKDMEHIAFGMVSMEDGTISTRNGKIIFLEDVLNKAIEKSESVIRAKNPDMENLKEVAKDVGVGAIVFNTLSSGRIKDIVFSWDRALNFEGETGPYCQYTYARCKSVLRKAEYTNAVDFDSSALCDAQAQAVLKLIQSYPEAILRAMEANEPYMVTRHIVDICKAYNKFYFEQRILDAPENIRASRLALTDCCAVIIKSGLALIGVNTPEKM